jgi:HEPN domain-containing protein
VAEKPNSLIPKEWIEKAKRDLRLAEIGKQSGDEEVTDGICLLSHQIVEKALKAIYLEKNGELPERTHDLKKLAGYADLPQLKEPEIAAAISALNEFFVPMKYPKSLSEPPSWEVAVKAFDDAKRVFNLVKKLIYGTAGG